LIQTNDSIQEQFTQQLTAYEMEKENLQSVISNLEGQLIKLNEKLATQKVETDDLLTNISSKQYFDFLV
jgi:hypothetical protein